jgi:hypothetical protein
MKKHTLSSEKVTSRESKHRQSGGSRAPLWATALLLAAVILLPAFSPPARANDRGQEFRVTPIPIYPFSEELTGFLYTAYVDNWSRDFQQYQGGPAFSYSLNPAWQLWFGYIVNYTNNDFIDDTFEHRPFAGVKFVFARDNALKWKFFNFLRYEYKMVKNITNGTFTDYDRFRNRLGVEIPLGSKTNAFKPKSWYLLADAEPFYRLDRGEIELIRYRIGPGYVLKPGTKVELIYHAIVNRIPSTAPLSG